MRQMISEPCFDWVTHFTFLYDSIVVHLGTLKKIYSLLGGLLSTEVHFSEFSMWGTQASRHQQSCFVRTQFLHFKSPTLVIAERAQISQHFHVGGLKCPQLPGKVPISSPYYSGDDCLNIQTLNIFAVRYTFVWSYNYFMCFVINKN